MMLFCCIACTLGPCELRILSDRDPPCGCSAGVVADPHWLPVPSGRSTMPQTGLDLLPGPFCELPPRAIVRAVAEAGRYSIEVDALDRLVIPVSRRAFNEALTAMEAVSRDAVQ